MSASILVLDDDEIVRRTLAFILKHAGHQVTTADHPQDAITCLDAGNFDLLILDLLMPDMDGLSLLGEIRKKHPVIPVLILTGHAGIESAIQAMRLNARDYLIKPVEPSVLIERIQKVLDEEEKRTRKTQMLAQLKNLINELEQLETPNNISSQTTNVPIDTSRFLQKDNFILDLKAQQVEINNRPVSLPPSTFNYLVTLLRHSPRAVGYESLVLESQGNSVTDNEARSTSRWQIYQLRHSIEPDADNPIYILTVRNIGYRLVTKNAVS
jgi:DNA-binding response OmpR family regulator